MIRKKFQQFWFLKANLGQLNSLHPNEKNLIHFLHMRGVKNGFVLCHILSLAVVANLKIIIGNVYTM